MSLRTQLMLISLLVLALPLGAWQFARQVEQTLRDGHARGLQDSALAMAPVIGAEMASQLPELSAPGGSILYVHQAEQAPRLDGYADDWTNWLETSEVRASEDGQLKVNFAAARHASGLYLLFEVYSPDQVFSMPGGPRGDHVRLSFQRPQGRSTAVTLAPLAPGWIEARGNDPGGWPRVQGYWQPRRDGWTLELQIPDDQRPTQLGFEVHDQVPGRADARIVDQVPAHLVSRHKLLDRQLELSAPPGSQAWAVLDQGWVLGQADRRQHAARRPLEEPSWLGTLLFERLLSGRLPTGQWRDDRTARLIGGEIGAKEPATHWTTRADDPGIVLSVSAPIMIEDQQVGAVVLSRNADALLVQSNRAVLRLVGVSLATLLLVTLILLGFATLLSERIRRLRDNAEQAVGPDGRVRELMRAPRAGDELGDLGRSVSGLLLRLREHQTYLRTLADKLAHELRTPLAMIRSSLDNLEHAREPDEIARYCRRANEGSARLNRIFQAMSQAARIEESIRRERTEDFDVVKLAENYLQACESTYPERRFRLVRQVDQALLRGSPDLFAQLLDKLVDNAVDFTPDGGLIELRMSQKGDQIHLHVSNEGPALPEGVADSLFDSMVSRRNRKSDQVHLGLGLYIARLIVEHHCGSIRASNSKTGVRMEMTFPLVTPPGKADANSSAH